MRIYKPVYGNKVVIISTKLDRPLDVGVLKEGRGTAYGKGAVDRLVAGC